MLSPLLLETHELEELEVIANPRADVSSGANESYRVDLDRDIQPAPEDNCYTVHLAITLKAATRKARFRKLHIKMLGQFRLAPQCPPELAEQLIPGSALAILYGIMRGVVAQATGVTHFGQFVLPTVKIDALIGPPSPEPEAK